MTFITRQLTTGVLAAAVLAFGCDETPEQIDRAPNPSSAPAVFVDVQQDITHVSGYVWDPEVFWMTVAECGQTCPFPPLVVPGVPTIERSLIGGAKVSLFDPKQGKPTFAAPEVTPPTGTFYIDGVTSRTGVPFLVVVAPPPPNSNALRPIDPPFLTPVPKANYLPTFVQKPVYTAYTECLGQSAPIASDKGILEAVAKHLTATGTATAVGDFVDPAKFGGVAISWLFTAADPPVRVPAFNTGMTTSVGTVLNIDWAPPGVLPPEANQSTRGFFVAPPTATRSAFGITVLLLPPLQGPPPKVQFTPTDVETGPRRPYSFPKVPPIVVPPGLISYIELPALVPGAPKPPQWVCLNPFGN